MVNVNTKNSSDVVRLFVAIPVPETVKNELIRIQKSLEKKHVLVGTYPKPSAMHITLKFIGEVSTAQLQDVQHALSSILAPAMRAQLTLPMVFGNPRFPKVIYVDVDCPGVARLVQQLDNTLEALCSPEQRAFVCHLTLVRVKQVLDSDGLLTWLDEIHVEPLSFMADNFVLMQSELVPSGPLYTELGHYALTAI